MRRCLPLTALLLFGCPELKSRTPIEDVELYSEFVLVDVLEGHPAAVTCVSWGELGTRLISGDAQGLVFIWDVTQPETPLVLAAHEGPVMSVALAAADTIAFSVGMDGRSRMWNAVTGELLAEETFEGAGAAAIAPDGTTMEIDTRDAPVTQGLPVAAESHDPLIDVENALLAYSPNAEVALAAGTRDDKPVIHVRLMAPDFPSIVVDLEEMPAAIAASPTATGGAAAYADGRIDLVDGATPRPFQHSLAWSLEFTPGGGALTAASQDGPIDVWAVDDGRALNRLVGHEGPVWDLSYQRDGDMLASAGNDGTVRIWAPQAKPCECTCRCEPAVEKAKSGRIETGYYQRMVQWFESRPKVSQGYRSRTGSGGAGGRAVHTGWADAVRNSEARRGGGGSTPTPTAGSTGSSVATSGGGSRRGGPRGNNGVGNGVDPQPPGNPPVNDGAGTGPGNPGRKGPKK